MSQKISIHSFRGGTGKTNTTANIGALLALAGLRAAVIDTDIQSPGLHVLFDVDTDGDLLTLNDYMWGECQIDEAGYDVIPYDMAELGFYDEADNRMVVRATADYALEEGEEVIKYFEPETARFYDVNEGILARLVEKRSALLIADMQTNEDLELGAARKWGGKEAKSYLGVVLKAKGKVIGSIEMISNQPHKFDEDNSRLLSSIAVEAALEVQNAQEVQERERRRVQQIQQMDIVIDKEKQAEQIDDIVGSVFFKIAQDKAKKPVEVNKSSICECRKNPT